MSDYCKNADEKHNIGIFGGTFNPIHNGHMTIAGCALEQFALDRIIFIPTGHTAYKDYAGEDMSMHRLRMVELAVASEPRFSVSSVEIESGHVNYTYQTLERMQSDHPDSQLFFIIGGDSLSDFPIWRRPEKICKEAVILVAARADCGDTDLMIDDMAARFGGDFCRIDAPILDISSTEIRRMVKEGSDITSLVPPAVADYIYSNHLYKE